MQKEQIIEVNEPTQFQEVIVPELSCRAGIVYTKEYPMIFDAVRDAEHLDKKVYDSIYFTRLKSKALRGTELGEKNL